MPSRRDGPLSPLLLWVCAAALTFGAAVFLTKGLYLFFTSPVFALDARSRWTEQQYVIRGQNPYDVAFANAPDAQSIAPATQASVMRDARVDLTLGVPRRGIYPPWAYLTGILFFWTPAPWLRIYYGAWMIAGLLTMAAWLLVLSRGLRPSQRAILCLAPLACGAWCGAIFTGNYPAVVVPLLCVALWLDGLKRPWLAGLALGVALVKPSLALPFVVPFAVSGRLKTVTGALAYATLASLGAWYMTGTNPAEMLRQMLAMSRLFVEGGYGPTQYLIRAGLDSNAATMGMAVAGLGLGSMLLFQMRHRPRLQQFAVASVVARFWSYHFYYDDAVMIFLLVPFALSAASTPARRTWYAFLAVGSSLWIPARFTDFVVVQLAQQLIWLAAAALVIVDWPWIRRSDSGWPPAPTSAASAPQAPASRESPPATRGQRGTR